MYCNNLQNINNFQNVPRYLWERAARDPALSILLKVDSDEDK